MEDDLLAPREFTETVPLMYCSKGNVPVASLTYTKDWEINDTYFQFREFWHDAQGELVKNNVHMYMREGITIGGSQAGL